MYKTYFMTKFLFIFVMVLCIYCQEGIDPTPQPTPLQPITIENLKTITYSKDELKRQFTLDIPKDKIPSQDEWFLFIEVQSTESKDALGKPTKMGITIQKNDVKKNLDLCQIDAHWDSCFIKKDDFDPKSEKILFSVECDIRCEYEIYAYFDIAKPLKVDSDYMLNFEDTPYSQVFRVNVSQAENYDELEILLEPYGWLKYPEPINLYANWGKQLPTEEKNSYKSMNTWNNGKGIFIKKKQIQDSTQKILTILVEGPQRNVLTLSVNTRLYKESKTLAPHLPKFEHAWAEETRKYIFYIKNQDANYNVITSVFTGAIETPTFTNPSKNNEKLSDVRNSQQHSKMSFHFSKQYIKIHKLTLIEFQIKAIKNSTFLVELWAAQRDIVPLFNHVARTSVMSFNQTDQYLIRVNEEIEADKKEKKSRIQIDVNVLNGDTKVRFIQCKQSTTDAEGMGPGMGHMRRACHLTTEQLSMVQTLGDKFLELTPTKKQGNQTNRKYWFDVEWQWFIKNKEDGKEETVMMMVVAVQNSINGQTVYEIQYNNVDRIHPLVEGDLMIDRIGINQQRLYELAFNDPDILEVRIHLTKISGQLKIQGIYEDPRFINSSDLTVKLPINNLLIMPIDHSKSQKNIFVKAKGKEDSLFSLMTQIIRNSESDPNKKNSTGYNEVIIYESTPYEFIMEPGEKLVLQVRAGRKFTLHLKSNLPLDFCGTENLRNPPFAPNCQAQEKSVVIVDDLVVLEKGQIANIGVTNNNKQKADFKLQISKDEALCELAAMGHVMQKYIGSDGKDREGDNFHCLMYYLQRAADLEVNVKIDNGVYNKRGQIMIKIGNQTIDMIDPVHHFTEEELKILCGQFFKPNSTDFCYMQLKINNISDTTVHVMVQYTDKFVRLLDGFSHISHSRMIKSKPKTFYYRMTNKKETTIFLENKAGQYKIFAKLFDLLTFEQASLDNSTSLIPSKENNQFQSNNPFYFLEQIITISTDDIKKYCQAVECVLMISVHLTGDDEVKEDGKFIIECTQQSRLLEAGVPAQGYLPNKAVDFYTYQNTVDNGSIIISISNQNMKCLSIYINQGTNRATVSSNKESAKLSNVLILQKSPKDLYSITLESNDHCPYTIQVSSSKSYLKQIKKGLFTDIDMELGEIRYMIYENLVNQTFKVLSTHKIGQAKISVKSIKTQQLADNTDFDSMKDYVWINKDSVRIDNVKVNGQAHPNYCVNCNYLIKIEAIRKSEASVMIPTPNVEIPLTANQFIKDILKKQQKSTYRIFTQSHSSFELNIQYGKIRMEIIDTDDNNRTVLNKTYQSQKGVALERFALKNNTEYQFLRYSRIIITALEESYFSFEIFSSNDQSKRGNKLSYGIPYYIFLDKNKQKCVDASIDRYDDSFLLSFDNIKDQDITKISISLKLNNKAVDFNKQVGKRELILNFPLSKGKIELGNYNLCLKSTDKSCSLTVVQSSPLVYFPAQVPIAIKDELNLTFGSTGKNIIEINECQDRMRTGIYSQFGNLKEDTSQIKQNRRRNNILEFYFFGPVFASFRVPKGSVRWFPYDVQKGVGVGYDEYETGKLRVFKNGNKIEVNADPLASRVKQKTGTIQEINYIAYAAIQEIQLYTAMNCLDGKYVSNYLVDAGYKLSSVVIPLDIQELKNAFGNNNYFLIGLKAEVVIKNKNGKIENYRFYYPYQEVTREMISNDQQWIDEIDEIDEEEGSGFMEQMMQIIGWVTFSIMMFFLIYFLYHRVISRWINRRRRLPGEQTGTQLRYAEFSNTH